MCVCVYIYIYIYIYTHIYIYIYIYIPTESAKNMYTLQERKKSKEVFILKEVLIQVKYLFYTYFSFPGVCILFFGKLCVRVLSY